jgi:hypothetical protein
MRDMLAVSTADPQSTHKLFIYFKPILWISC